MTSIPLAGPAVPSSPPTWCTSSLWDLRPTGGPGWLQDLLLSDALPGWNLQRQQGLNTKTLQKQLKMLKKEENSRVACLKIRWHFCVTTPITVRMRSHQNPMLQQNGSVSQSFFSWTSCGRADALGNDFHHRLVRRWNLIPAQLFGSPQSASRCSCQSPRSETNTTANRTTRCRKVGPVMLIIWDPAAAQLLHKPAVFCCRDRFGVNAASLMTGVEVLFLTLRLLSSHFGEEGNLSDSYKWQTQNLQKHPDDELSQLPREVTWRAKQSITKYQSMNK